MTPHGRQWGPGGPPLRPLGRQPRQGPCFRAHSRSRHLLGPWSPGRGGPGRTALGLLSSLGLGWACRGCSVLPSRSRLCWGGVGPTARGTKGTEQQGVLPST